MIQIFSADGRTDGTGPIEGSTRGPRGPKKGGFSSKMINIDSKFDSFIHFTIKFNSKDYSISFFLGIFNSKDYSIIFFPGKFNSKIDSKFLIVLD